MRKVYTYIIYAFDYVQIKPFIYHGAFMQFESRHPLSMHAGKSYGSTSDFLLHGFDGTTHQSAPDSLTFILKPVWFGVFEM